jgi:hypothetical protein
MGGRALASVAVDRRYKEAKGFQSTAAQAKQLAEQFLARSRYNNHVAMAAGSATGAERGTGGIGSGLFGQNDTPPQLSAPAVTRMRRTADKGRFDDVIGAEKGDLRPGSQRGDFYRKLRSS